VIQNHNTFSSTESKLACRALPLLVQQLENVAQEPERAAYAASALWALLHRGERVKATLKGIPGSIASVQRCHRICSALLAHEDGTEEPGTRAAYLQSVQETSSRISRICTGSYPPQA
jgi:hypothetical protein